MKMKSIMTRVLCLSLSLVMVLGLTACGNDAGTTSSKKAELLSMEVRPDAPEEIPDGLDIDWNHRYTYAELESQLAKMNETYPDITDLYPIGSSWQERNLWCLEITNKNIPAEDKTGIGVFANIHGDERESAACAMYTAWWMTLCSSDEYVKGLLDNYIIYVIPVINPDSYERSFVVKTRETLHPLDKNGDGVPYNDPCTDIDGDGLISTIYRGTADMDPATNGRNAAMTRFGKESPDWDGNGIMGDDDFNSDIDPNRNFEYTWNYNDVTTDVEGKDVIGGDAGDWNGTSPASEPEVRAVQDFLKKHPMDALVSIHTNIQAVLYPWCYRNIDENNPQDADLSFMAEVAEQMAGVFSDVTGRKYYSLNSWADYPTNAELIDYAYGKFGIHAYTIECYCGGTVEQNDGDEYCWGNEMPAPKWTFYSQDDIREKFNMDPTTLTDKNGVGLAENEGLWFYIGSYNQNKDAPKDQDLIVKGALDTILTMIHTEPYGEGYHLPEYYK